METLLRGLVWGVLAFSMNSAWAQGAARPDPFRDWKRVELKERGIPLFSGQLEMSVARDERGNILFATRSTARFLGARIAQSETLTTMDPATGRPLLYTDRSKKTARRYTFDDSGYKVEKLAPDNGADRPLEEWRIYFEQRFPFPDDGNGGRHPVFDYYGMFLHLRDTALEKSGDAIIVYLATSDGPTPFNISVAEVRDSTWTYRNPTRKGRETVPVRMLRLRVTPSDPERADEGFLQMEGETEMWVEADSKTLLSLGGKVPNVPGRVRLVLGEME